MIIYENKKENFIGDVISNNISDIIKDNMVKLGVSGGGKSEINSWINSLNFMKNIVDTKDISNDSYVALEYKIPFSNKRIDFMITGHDNEGNKNLVIIELKQWSEIEICSNKDDYLKTFTGGSLREVLHPSYQAKTYKYLLEGYNTSIEKEKINCSSCSYLHNASANKNNHIINLIMFNYVSEYPVYFKEDYQLLQDKLKLLVGKGKGKEILYFIENGELKPSKKLIDSIGDCLRGNNKFMLVETQKEVYENITTKVKDINNVFIVNGNPGTGKSVVAINLLNNLLKNNKLVQYVAPNSAFQNAIKDELKKHGRKNKNNDGIDILFRGAMNFIKVEKNTFDWVIVDEAHRLKNKQSLYTGKNQIDDIMNSSKNIVFFIDENQAIATNDIGTNKNILDSAKKFKKNIYYGDEYLLDTQFRCVGANGYINALDTTLQIKETANFFLNENNEYDIRICDTPQEMEKLINRRIKEGYKDSKILAGYAWEWISKKCLNDTELDLKQFHDITIPEHDGWSIAWNFNYSDMLWSTNSFGKRQAGSIHAVQGLEFEYCGVIVGNDLIIDSDNEIKGVYDNYYDKVGKRNHRGIGTLKLKDDNEELTRLIKNIYKILMTRGSKGTYIFIRDIKLREYFKKHLKK